MTHTSLFVNTSVRNTYGLLLSRAFRTRCNATSNLLFVSSSSCRYMSNKSESLGIRRRAELYTSKGDADTASKLDEINVSVSLNSLRRSVG